MLVVTLVVLNLLLQNHVRQAILLPSVKNFETMAYIISQEN